MTPDKKTLRVELLAAIVILPLLIAIAVIARLAF